MDIWQPTSTFITLSRPTTSSNSGGSFSTDPSPASTSTHLVFTSPTPASIIDSAYHNTPSNLNRLARRRELQYGDSAWADLNPANIKDLPTSGERIKFGFLFAFIVLRGGSARTSSVSGTGNPQALKETLEETMAEFGDSIKGGRENAPGERQRFSEIHDRNHQRIRMEHAQVPVPTATSAVAKHKTDPRNHIPAPIPPPGPVLRNPGPRGGMVSHGRNLSTGHAPHGQIPRTSNVLKGHKRPALAPSHQRARNSCTALPLQAQPFKASPVAPKPVVGANLQRPYSYHPMEVQRVASLDKATPQTPVPNQTRQSAAPYWRQGMLLERPPFPRAAYEQLQMPEVWRSSHTAGEQAPQIHRPADYHPLLSNPVQVPLFSSLPPSSLQDQNLTVPVSTAVRPPVRSPPAPPSVPTNRHPNHFGKGAAPRAAAVSRYPKPAKPAVGKARECPITQVRRAQSSAFPKFIKPERPSVLRRGDGGSRKKSVLMKKVKGKLSSTKSKAAARYEKREEMVRENIAPAPSSQSNRCRVPRKAVPMLQGRDSFNGPVSGMDSSASAPSHASRSAEIANLPVTRPLPTLKVARKDVPRLSLQIPQYQSPQAASPAAIPQHKPLTLARFPPLAPLTTHARPKPWPVPRAASPAALTNQQPQYPHLLQQYPQHRYYAGTRHVPLRKSSVLIRKPGLYDLGQEGLGGLRGNQTVEVLDRIDEGRNAVNEACHAQGKRLQGPPFSSASAREGSGGLQGQSTSLPFGPIQVSMAGESHPQKQQPQRLPAEPPRPDAMTLDDLATLVASRHPSSPSSSFSNEEAGNGKQPRRLTKRLRRFSRMKFDTWKSG
ncbi:MAG: hypothetical protein M1831_003216 [Alyxoria varia]|nr:MAG: hypothetical protein M1831_003216 [Alyxoria varia]